MDKIQERKMMADRLQEVVSACGMTLTDFFSEMGITYASSFISQIRAGRSGISPKVRRLIAENHPRINIDYILKGVSPMFLNEGENKYAVFNFKSQNLPYFPLPESSNKNSRTMKNWRENQLEQITVPTFMNCTCYANCHKKTMSPIIEIGDVMALKKADAEAIIYGEIYYIVARTGYFLYRATPNDDENLIDLTPSNNNYSKVTIKKADIEEAFQVKGVIRRI